MAKYLETDKSPYNINIVNRTSLYFYSLLPLVIFLGRHACLRGQDIIGRRERGRRDTIGIGRAPFGGERDRRVFNAVFTAPF